LSRRGLVLPISAAEQSPRHPSSLNECRLHGWRQVAFGQPMSAALLGRLSRYPFAFHGVFSLARLSRRLGEATHQLRLGGECQMQRSLTSASRRLHQPLLSRALAVQAAVFSLGHPRPNPFVKGTSRKRAAPYVER
jgi:hypothetical protein